MDHGFLKKSEQNQHIRQQMSRTDAAARKEEVVKTTRKVGHSTKTSRPSMEIYRPPSMRGSEYPQHTTNGHNSGAPKGMDHQSGSFLEFESALKRPKSFGVTDLAKIAAMGFERETFLMEFHGLVEQALLDPNSLSPRQLMQVVCVVCSKAVESLPFSEQAAQMCFTIIEKEKGEMFLQSLMISCREWYNKRDELLRCAMLGDFRRWTAYVLFLTQLYLRLKSFHRFSMSQITADQTLTLQMLLYECLQIILKPPSLGNTAEIECLRSVLSTVGQHLENDAPQRMQQLVCMMRDAFVNPSISAQVRKTLLELVELHASGWQLDPQQTTYYFPYAIMDRK